MEQVWWAVHHGEQFVQWPLTLADWNTSKCWAVLPALQINLFFLLASLAWMLSLLVQSITAGPPVQSVIQVNSKVPVSVRFDLHNHDADGYRPSVFHQKSATNSFVLQTFRWRRWFHLDHSTKFHTSFLCSDSHPPLINLPAVQTQASLRQSQQSRRQ